MVQAAASVSPAWTSTSAPHCYCSHQSPANVYFTHRGSAAGSTVTEQFYHPSGEAVDEYFMFPKVNISSSYCCTTSPERSPVCVDGVAALVLYYQSCVKDSVNGLVSQERDLPCYHTRSSCAPRHCTAALNHLLAAFNTICFVLLLSPFASNLYFYDPYSP